MGRDGTLTLSKYAQISNHSISNPRHRILNFSNHKILLTALAGLETIDHVFACINLLISRSPYLPILRIVLSEKRSLDQVSNKFRIGGPLNFEGPGHSGLRRDIWVWVDL